MGNSSYCADYFGDDNPRLDPNWRMLMKATAALALLVVLSATAARAWAIPPCQPKTIEVRDKSFAEVEEMVAAACSHDVMDFGDMSDSGCAKKLTFPRPLVIDKPLTILGLCARQKNPEDLEDPQEDEKFSLLIVESGEFVLKNFRLEGYYDGDTEDRIIKKKYNKNPNNNPYERNKHPLIWIKVGNFTVTDGDVSSSLKDGIMVSPDPNCADAPCHIDGGLIARVRGKGNHKDVVSIAGNGADGHVRNVCVHDITCTDSHDKGAVEVSDGTDQITLSRIAAKRSIYAVDVQDHYDKDEKDDEKRKKKKQETNRNVTIDNVEATDCEYAVRTANHDLDLQANGGIGHSDLTITKVTAERCSIPIRVSNTTNVTIRDVCIQDDKSGRDAPYTFDEGNPRIQLEGLQGTIVIEEIRIQDKHGVYRAQQVETRDMDAVALPEIGDRCGEEPLSSPPPAPCPAPSPPR